MAAAMFPGSFDPVHNGHLAIIGAASRIFDQIVVAVGHNPAKESGMFDGQERVELIEASVKSAGIENVRVVLFEGLVTEAAKAESVDCLVKGLRSGTDLDTEMLQANMNHLSGNGLPTVFVPAIGAEALISSRYIREIGSKGGDVRAVVPDAVADRITRKFDG